MANWYNFLNSPGAGDGDDTPGNTVPGDDTPGSTVPGDGTPGSTAPGDAVPSVAVPDGDPAPSPSVPWLWIGVAAGLAAVLIITLVITAVRRKKKRKKRAKKSAEFDPIEVTYTEQPAQSGQPAQPEPPGTAPQVGKLHQQGARASQQDCFSVSPADLIPSLGLLAVVADGMGGLSDGDKVSQTAVATMMNGFYSTQGRPEEVLLTLLGQANNEVNRLLGPGGLSKSGSTLVAGLIRDGKFYTLSVGDSRVCLYRGGVLYQLNREHIFRHELEQRAVNGEDDLRTAYTHPRGAGLTSYLGMGKLKYVDMPAAPTDIQAGDKFLLMSDGVYNALTQAELTACLNASAEEAAAQLDQAIRAKNYSNQDNYTAVILGF